MCRIVWRSVSSFGDFTQPATDFDVRACSTQLVPTTLSLLRATVFETDGVSRLVWQDTTSAGVLLRCPPEHMPNALVDFEARLDSDDAVRRRDCVKGLTFNGAQYALTYQIHGFDGRCLWVEERGRRVAGTGKTAENIVTVLTDISEQIEALNTRVYRAHFDAQTGLWNKDRLRETLTYMLSVAERYDRPAGFIALQVRNLDDINKTYGFETGSRFLKDIAERLKQNVRAPDAVGRIGETVFGIGLSECPEEALEPLAKRIIKTLSDKPYPGVHGDLYAEFSVSGVLLSRGISGHAASAEQAFVQTLGGLSESANRNGQFVAADPFPVSVQNGPAARKTRADDIQRALDEGRISLAYQPIVDAKSRDLHHYECLLRLTRKTGQLVSAGEFIQDAEKLNLVHLLDRRALELASVTLTQTPDIKLALNVSAGTIKNRDAADEYLATLKSLGDATKRLTLELTETVALDDPAQASRFSVEARTLGIEFSIDDFGSGYTTFQNLMAIEADSIKIDGTFVHDLSATPHKQTFVRMMVDLAQTFSVKTVAEFVDNPENADLLTRLGVDYLQGYLFGIPAPTPNYQNKTR